MMLTTFFILIPIPTGTGLIQSFPVKFLKITFYNNFEKIQILGVLRRFKLPSINRVKLQKFQKFQFLKGFVGTD